MSTEKLWEAVQSRDAEGVQQAIRNGASVKSFDYRHTPLEYACAVGDDRIVRILLDAGMDARWQDDWGQSAMESACTKGHLSIVEMLLNHDKDLLEFANQYGWTPLFFAADRGRVDVVRFLLERGANIYGALESGTTVLMVACIRGDLNVMRLLLTAGIDVEARDKLQQTALLAYCCRNAWRRCSCARIDSPAQRQRVCSGHGWKDAL